MVDRGTIVQVPVSDLHFDPDNPRLPQHIDPKDEQDVLNWMLQDAGLVELIGSIAVNGFFAGEPLLVVRKKGRLIVVEGNRRLAAVKLINEPRRAPSRKLAVASAASLSLSPPRSLPCVEFRLRNEILAYLGYRHITGIKEWEPYAKAKYLNELWSLSSESDAKHTCKTLARQIGSRSDYVARLLTSFDLHSILVKKRFFVRHGLQQGDLSFSLLTLALQYRPIVQYLGLDALEERNLQTIDRMHLTHLARWIFVPNSPEGATILGDSRNMKILAAVLKNAQATAALEEGAELRDAAISAQDPSELFAASLRTARDRMIVGQRYVHLLKEVSPQTLSLTAQIIELAEQIDLLLQRVARKSNRRPS